MVLIEYLCISSKFVFRIYPFIVTIKFCYFKIKENYIYNTTNSPTMKKVAGEKASGASLFCRDCGKKIEPGSKFCNYCGTPTESDFGKKSEEGIGPKPPGEKPSRGRFIVIALIVIILLSGLVYYIINYENMNETEIYSYNPGTIPNSLSLDLDIEQSGAEIVFTSDMNESLVEIEYLKNWQGVVTRQPSFEYTSDKVTFESSKVIGSSDSEIIITLRSDVKYKIEAKVTSGSISINSELSNMTFSSINLESSSGSSSINCENAVFTGSISMKSSSGSSSLNLVNCSLVDIRTKSSSGSSSINLERCKLGKIDTSFS
jgi:hypothetical protein